VSGGRAPSSIPFRNPGWAGNTGEFDLTEAQVRGDDYVGTRPLDGGHPSGAPTYPYMLAEKDPEAPLFEGPYRVRFDKILSRYPDRLAALLPALNLAQELRGHVSPATMDEVAALLSLPEAYVRGVATFYTMYNKRPVGRFLVQVCTNISCNLCGGDEVLRSFLEHVGVELGETSPDGLFTITEVECLAACGFPTAVQVNSRYYENVTPAGVPDLIERLRKEAAASPRRVTRSTASGNESDAAARGETD
jgi:NADH-quinone oxidoreductase E subunit